MRSFNNAPSNGWFSSHGSPTTLLLCHHFTPKSQVLLLLATVPAGVLILSTVSSANSRYILFALTDMFMSEIQLRDSIYHWFLGTKRLLFGGRRPEGEPANYNVAADILPFLFIDPALWEVLRVICEKQPAPFPFSIPLGLLKGTGRARENTASGSYIQDIPLGDFTRGSLYGDMLCFCSVKAPSEPSTRLISWIRYSFIGDISARSKSG